MKGSNFNKFSNQLFVSLNSVFSIKYLVKGAVIFYCLFFNIFAYSNPTNVKSSSVFAIQEGVTFVGLVNDEYIFINEKENIYIFENTIFLASEQLFANIIKIESKNKSLASNLSNLKAKIDLVSQAEAYRGKIDLFQVKALPFNKKHASFCFFAYLDCFILPVRSNHYHNIAFIENFLSFLTNQIIFERKSQDFVYHQFITAFTLNILLLNRPPPVLSF